MNTMAKAILALSMTATIASLPLSAMAQEDDAFVNFQVLKPEIALEMAQAAMESCREAGYQVAVAVVDRFGLTQVILRDRFAGAHTTTTAERKAWTAVSFRTNTLELDEVTRPGSLSAGIRQVDKALPLGGGVPVESGGSLIAGIGISGAPGPDVDDECARAGIDAIEDQLGF